MPSEQMIVIEDVPLAEYTPMHWARRDVARLMRDHEIERDSAQQEADRQLEKVRHHQGRIDSYREILALMDERAAVTAGREFGSHQ